MTQNILEIKNLNISFSQPNSRMLHAVRDLSLIVARKETLGIVGESGSGKSVTIKTILKLLPEPPAIIDKGEILYNGQDILKMKSGSLRSLRGREISMIFQNPSTAFNPVLPIGKQIAEALEFHEKLSPKERGIRVIKLLEEVGISKPDYRAKQHPHEFSGGMLQRAMIASSLIASPKLLLADEPTTGLDVTIQDQIIKLISKLKAKREMSIIWITHDLSLLAGFADQIAVMYAGTIVEHTKTEELYKNPKHPYTRGMLKSIPTLITKKQNKLFSIPGLPPNSQEIGKGCAFFERCDSFFDKCAKEQPPLIHVSDGHTVACWLYS